MYEFSGIKLRLIPQESRLIELKIKCHIMHKITSCDDNEVWVYH